MSGVTLAAATVWLGTALVALALFVLALALGVWAVIRQNRMFPKGFDRTGWSPEPGHAGWFLTKFTWLSGGRGG